MILESVIDWVESKVTLYASPIYIDFFPTETGEMVMFRHDPSQATETRYMDKTRTGSFIFSIYCRSAESDVARSALDTLIDLLDLPEFFPIDPGCNIKCEALTTKVPVQKTDLNEYVYTASLGLEYYTEG
jgi:hypothetical protein